MELLEDLQFRGLINQMTDEEGLRKLLNEEIMLRRFQLAGHQPVALVGGATGLIGDPSGRKTERTLNSVEVVAGWVKSIQNQLSQFLDFDTNENPAIMANNYDWISKMDVISFLRDVGKHFGLNYMLAKDSVQSRLETGISFTEFSYQILQSLDFLKLYETENVRLQVGGSDQWGNITAGLELIRKTKGDDAKAFGLTVPLVTKADGTKFGKSEGNAVWLDPEKTTPYEFYQFWINTDDRDVVKYLKYFTFLSHEEILELEKATEEVPEKRLAQKALAEDVTKLVHGEEALQQAIRISDALFNGDIRELSATEIEQGFKDVPSYINNDETIGLVDLLVNAKISPSKRQAREDIQNGAIYINGDRKTDLQYILSSEDKIEGKYTVIRRGKKKYFLIKHS